MRDPDDELPPCVGEKMREIAQTLGSPNCLHYASDIERKVPMAKWKDALKRVPEDCQPECRDYLAGMWIRAQAARRARGGSR